jgi:rhamnogalacturonan acetylesterase
LLLGLAACGQSALADYAGAQASPPSEDVRQWTPSDLSKINPRLPMLIIAGDSTAATGNPTHRGWGAPLVDYFDTNRINVINRARGGRSFRSFLREKLWEQVVGALRAGDFVVIEFGHNDGGDLPGVGEETKEATLPTGATETVHTYGWYVRKFVRDAKAKGAVPIVSTTTVRNIWNDGKVERGMGRMLQWARQVAQEENIAFLDHSDLIADRYEKMGQKAVKAFFPEDHTETSTAGAILNAEAFVSGLKIMTNMPLAEFLNDKGKAVQ